jgi:hypothetical protein
MSENEQKQVKTYAHIIDGKVVNVSVWADEPNIDDEELVLIPETSLAGIGWDYSNETFTDNRPDQELLDN